MEELRELLMRIEDEALRDQILRALERRGKITPEVMLEEIRKAIDQLNSEDKLRRIERALGLFEQPAAPLRHPDQEIQVTMYGPQPVMGGGTGDVDFRWRDSTTEPIGWYDSNTAAPGLFQDYRVVSGNTITLDED